MSEKQLSEEKWEVIKSSQQTQEQPVTTTQQTKSEDWEQLQAEEVTQKSEIQVQPVKEEWQLVGQLPSAAEQQDEGEIQNTSLQTPQAFQTVAKDITDSVSSVQAQIKSAVKFVTNLPSRTFKLIRGAKSSEVGVVVLGVVAGGLLVSLLALSNSTYFWKSKAQRIYGDMIKLVKKTEDVNGVLVLSRQTLAATTEFA
eukprot:TRINITY_DN274_c0_g1_i1.p2 TRINITY_DN274_c0_g1~~TRINITY_DN274_c0_g1_i1.p2  ORF type:complete len:198 (-),score=43.33 TRINITY_DN274_c0_g1_i1:399-992(-)